MCEMKIGIAGEGTERKCAYTQNTRKSGPFLPTSCIFQLHAKRVKKYAG